MSLLNSTGVGNDTSSTASGFALFPAKEASAENATARNTRIANFSPCIVIAFNILNHLKMITMPVVLDSRTGPGSNVPVPSLA